MTIYPDVTCEVKSEMNINFMGASMILLPLHMLLLSMPFSANTLEQMFAQTPRNTPVQCTLYRQKETIA